MKDFVITKDMNPGPSRVPVMIEKKLAGRLADYLLENGQSHYDATLKQVILLGIEAIKQKTPSSKS